MLNTERKKKLEESLGEKYIAALYNSVQNEEKCLIIEGIRKIGKTIVINKLKEKLDKKSLVIFKNSPPKNLDGTFRDVIESLNKELPKEIRLRRNYIIPNLDDVYNSGGAIETVEKIMNDEDVKNSGFLRVSIIIDDVNITKDDTEQLGNILNALDRYNYKFHIILSPKKPNDELANYKVIRIRCFNENETCGAFSNKINGSIIKDFHKLYRGHQGFINMALDNNYITNSPSPELRVDPKVVEIFEYAAKDISNFFDKLGNNFRLRNWCKYGLECLFTFFLFCEKEICKKGFKGINYNYLSNDFMQIVNELVCRHSEKSDIEKLEGDPSEVLNNNLSLKEAFDKIFEFLRGGGEELCKYLENEENCIKLYPLLIEWLLNERNYLFDTDDAPLSSFYLPTEPNYKHVSDQQFREKIKAGDACCNHA